MGNTDLRWPRHRPLQCCPFSNLHSFPPGLFALFRQVHGRTVYLLTSRHLTRAGLALLQAPPKCRRVSWGIPPLPIWLPAGNSAPWREEPLSMNPNLFPIGSLINIHMADERWASCLSSNRFGAQRLFSLELVVPSATLSSPQSRTTGKPPLDILFASSCKRIHVRNWEEPVLQGAL